MAGKKLASLQTLAELRPGGFRTKLHENAYRLKHLI